MRIFDDITETVGRTPLVKLHKMPGAEACTIYAKLEFFNPLSCVKERIAKRMVEAAEESGDLKPGGTLIEPTSGNTGLGLAMVAAAKGYKLVITMPETMSVERRAVLQHMGAEIVLTNGDAGMVGAIEKAEELQKKYPNSIIPQQFANPANPEAHYQTTGPEIWEDLDGHIDCLVAGVGTGGTITGVGKYLKEQNPQVTIVAVEPSESAVISGKPAGKHGIQGIGAGFIPDVLDLSVLDETICIQDLEAIKAARKLAAEEGILCGISSGAAMAAASKVAAREDNRGKSIVVIFPDTGERYLSTNLIR